MYYVHDAAIGGTAPRWGQPGVSSDGALPAGGTGVGCVVSGRISRLQVSGETMTGAEQVLVEDFCQQYPSHAGGGLEFGPDGYLYYSGGEGASFGFTDYGQGGDPVNPCGDPPGGVGGSMSPPTAEGGKLRSQDFRSTCDPLGLSGAVIRIDPRHGCGSPGQPALLEHECERAPHARLRAAQPVPARDPARRRRRLGGRRRSGAVGGDQPGDHAVRGPAQLRVALLRRRPQLQRHADQQHAQLDQHARPDLCESLYRQGRRDPAVLGLPPWSGDRDRGELPGAAGLGDLSGMAFAPAAGSFPDTYDGALFFSDHSRECIWVLRADANGLPDPATKQAFAQAADFPVDLEFGPNGELFYPDIVNGNVRRISFTGGGRQRPADRCRRRDPAVRAASRSR